MQAMGHDWVNAMANGKRDIDTFRGRWLAANPYSEVVPAIRQEIGQLKGMQGGGPNLDPAMLKKAMEFLDQRKRHWNSGRFTCSKRKLSIASLSAFGRPTSSVVNIWLTKSALRPLTGWVRIPGCSAFG